jgi:hypothetical protein
MKAGLWMNNKSRIIIFPVVFLLLLLLVILQNWQLLTNNKNSVVYTYLQSFASGEIGSGYGSSTAADIPFPSLNRGYFTGGMAQLCLWKVFACRPVFRRRRSAGSLCGLWCMYSAAGSLQRLYGIMFYSGECQQ